MKRKFLIVFSILTTSVFTLVASNIQVDGIYYDLNENTHEATVTYKGDSMYTAEEDRYIDTVVIPEKITYNDIEYDVTTIGFVAFAWCNDLRAVIIPNSITKIKDAFYACENLTSLDIPASVEKISNSYGWFPYCNSLISINIDANNQNYSSTDGVMLNKEGTELLFYPRGRKGEYVIPSCVTEILGAFEGCSGLTSVTIPNSVTSIGTGSFSGCTNLRSIEIPQSITFIGKEAFVRCDSLSSITWNAKRCNDFSVKYVPYQPFDSVAVKTITIGEDVEHLPACFGLGLQNVTSLHWNARNCDDWSYDWMHGDNLFPFGDNSNNIKEVTLGANVSYAPTDLLQTTNQLTSIIVDSENKLFDSRNNCNALIETSSNKLIAGCQNTIIPNSITSIGNHAFDRCTGLISIIIPNNVTSIEEAAFYTCENLENIILGSAVKILEESALWGCTAIKTITCYSQRPPTIGKYAFESLDYSTIVYVPADYLDTYKMHDAWGLYDVRPLGAATRETEDVAVTPHDNTAEVVWPAVSGATIYELVIKDKAGNVICTLVFNANGQLTSIAFVSARDNAPQQTQSAGFAFTVTGLNSGTGYDLTMTSKDGSGETLQTKTVSFTTTGEAPQGIDDINAATKSQKILRDNQVLILRGDKMYTVIGLEVK